MILPGRDNPYLQLDAITQEDKGDLKRGETQVSGGVLVEWLSQVPSQVSNLDGMTSLLSDVGRNVFELNAIILPCDIDCLCIHEVRTPDVQESR